MTKNYHIIPLAILVIALLAESYYILNVNTYQIPASNYKNNTTSTNNQIADNKYPNSRSIGYGVINYLNHFNKEILSSSVVNSEYRGTLTKIFNTPGSQSGVEYEKGIFIKPINGKFGNYFLFTKNNTKIMKIHLIDGREIKFDSLRIGDKVVVNEKIDLFKKYPDTRVSIEITKS